MFNRWVEAVPSKDQSATTVIKFLTGEVKTRLRNKLRQNVYSENTQTCDSTFACQIKTRLRPNPQPQGMVERGMGRFRQRLTELN